MRLLLTPFILLSVVYAAAPALSAILPLVEAQEIRDPKNSVAETSVEKTTYDEQGQLAPSEDAASSSPRHSLEENLRIRNRRGYTISLEPSEAIASEQSPATRRSVRENLTAFTLRETAYGSLSAGDTSLASRIQPLASSFQPLWVALVPMSVIDPSTGQMVTVLVGVLGPSVGQNGFLSAIGGNTVLAGSLVAPTPVASVASRSVQLPTLQRFASFGALPNQADSGVEPPDLPPVFGDSAAPVGFPLALTPSVSGSRGVQLSTLQKFGSFIALPNQANDGGEAAERPSLLDASDDPKSDHRVASDADISAAVPEPSTWAMMLLGIAGLATVSRTRKRAIS